MSRLDVGPLLFLCIGVALVANALLDGRFFYLKQNLSLGRTGERWIMAMMGLVFLAAGALFLKLGL